MQEIFKMTPHQKQVMMFSATLSKEVRPVCKKFMHNVSACVWNDTALELFIAYMAEALSHVELSGVVMYVMRCCHKCRC